MIEEKGDLWAAWPAANALCITTNGSLVKLQGGLVRGVMGRGIALQAKQRSPYLETILGDHVRRLGNHVHVLEHTIGGPHDQYLLSFPVKHTWDQKADLALIERSAYELVEMTDKGHWTRVLLPRPGCGNGGLTWETVKPAIAFLDDRFVVMEWA